MSILVDHKVVKSCMNNNPKKCNTIQFIYICNCTTCFGWYLTSSS